LLQLFRKEKQKTNVILFSLFDNINNKYMYYRIRNEVHIISNPLHKMYQEWPASIVVTG